MGFVGDKEKTRPGSVGTGVITFDFRESIEVVRSLTLLRSLVSLGPQFQMLVSDCPTPHAIAIGMAHPTQPIPSIGENFQTFFNGWLIRQQNLFNQLLLALTPENCHRNSEHQTLIDRVLSHYQQYYLEKSLAAGEDVFLFLSPPWLSSMERTFLWIGGFRPSLLFKLLSSSVKDLTSEQEREIEQLKAETRRGERELSETMARVQERLAAPPLMNVARRIGNLVDGEVLDAESAMKELQRGMVAVLESADGIRGRAAGRLKQILCPIQAVKLLAAFAQFQLTVRSWGLQRDQERATQPDLLQLKIE